MAELTSGRTLHQRFTLIRPLGEGGMAQVWLVHDAELAEEVAAKIVPAGGDDQLELLRRECRHARRLVHPHIVPVFDFHRGNRFHLITMAYVEGRDAGTLRGGDPQEIARLLVPVADALAYAHRMGVVHRDLKVGHVLRDAEGRPHLLDFGIAGRLEAHRGKDGGKTVSGGGSRYNVSPQQLDGAEPSTADDLYAFGVLLYELLSGAPPFWPDITPDRVRAEEPAEIRSPHAIPDPLRELVRALLAKTPESRPRDMATVRSELERIVGPVASRPGSPPNDRTAVRLTPPPRVQRIRPVEPVADRARVPPKTAPPMVTVTSSSRRWLHVVGAIVVLVALVVFDVYYLVPWLKERRERARQAAESEPPAVVSGTASGTAESELQEPRVASPPSARAVQNDGEEERRRKEARQEAYLRDRARTGLQRAATLRDDLEEKGAGLWGAEALEAASEALARGDEHLTAGDYDRADAEYSEALRVLDQLEGRSIEVLERLLAEGRSALDAGDATAAAAAFDLAARIAPEARTAQAGARRAEVLDDVTKLLDEGARSERAGRLGEARERYERAVALDPMSARAQGALAAVQTRISDDEFARTMSQGLAALAGDDYGEAREAFRRAESMRPGAAEVADGMAQVDEAQKLEAIAYNRREATRLEAIEQWEDAAERYEAALEMDAAIKFAQEGRTRCLLRADLSRRIDFHLGHPDRLSSDAVFREANELLAEARGIDPAGPRHRQQVHDLDELLTTAGMHIRVRLESDNLTEVTVYKVGRLGTFERHELELRPGTYTVVGSRKGYRDVRRKLVIVAGQQPAPLLVRCEEKI